MSDRRVFYLKDNSIRSRVCEYVRIAPEGYRVEIKEAKRTLEQNDKMWAMLADVSSQVVWYGQKLPPDDWKDIFTASLRKARVVPGLDAGTFVPLGMRTSDMGKQEMSDLIELIYAFGAERDVKWSEPKERQPATSPPPPAHAPIPAGMPQRWPGQRMAVQGRIWARFPPPSNQRSD
jgi:hypothetical protein